MEPDEVDDIAQVDSVDEVPDRAGDDQRNADGEELAPASGDEHPEEENDGSRSRDVKHALAHCGGHVAHEPKRGATVLGVAKLEQAVDQHHRRALTSLRLGPPVFIGLAGRVRGP